jgi:hypothetical protein
MTESDLFWQYAKEAMRSSCKSTDENEKRDLIDLACIWAQAALMSEGVFGPSFASPPRDDSEATSQTRQISIRSRQLSPKASTAAPVSAAAAEQQH